MMILFMGLALAGEGEAASGSQGFCSSPSCIDQAVALKHSDRAKAQSILLEVCEGSGNQRACTELAIMEIEEQRYEVGVPRIERACASGYADACANLGWMHTQGEGVPLDAAKALYYFESSCEEGSALGCYNYGHALQIGYSTERDVGRAMGILQEACNDGQEDACAKVGAIQASGELGPPDVAAARSTWEASCARGGAWSCTWLVQTNITSDPPRAAAYAEQACDQGVTHLCVDAGELREATGDKAAARKAFERGCEAGQPDACSGLARLVEAEDPARALTLYYEACGGGSVQGCTLLGERMLPSQPAKAEELLSELCSVGTMDACRVLAVHQPERAVDWYKQGCFGGSGDSCHQAAQLGGGRKVRKAACAAGFTEDCR